MMLLILLVLASVGIWILWPWPVAAWFNRSLPMRWGGDAGSFTLATTGALPLPVDASTQAHLLIPAEPARRLLADLSGYSIPHYILRGGLSGAGTFELAELGPGQRPWQAEATWSGGPPRLTVRIPAADVNHLLAYRLSLQPDSPLKQCTVTMLRIHDETTPETKGNERRFAIEAAGEVVWRYLGMNHTINVRHCTACLQVRFVDTLAGLHPVMHLEITELNTPVLSIPLIGQIKHLIIPVIEKAIDTSLAMRLEGVVIPAWFPRDLSVDAAAVSAPTQP